MKLLATLLVVGVVGAVVRRADVDINRIKQISNQEPVAYAQSIQESGRLLSRSNDYDDHSSWYKHESPLPSASETSKSSTHVYQPREDPRLYYQSDAYLNENVREKVNDEVAFVYPGRQVVRAGEDPALARMRTNELENSAARSTAGKICMKCPHDLTLVAKASFGRVVLQIPPLRTCSGRKARNVRFEQMYGPKVGSLLEQGSHMIIGRLMYKNRDLQLCKIQVHVVTQGCVVPKHLTAHCWNQNKLCNFNCTNKHLELSGPKTQVCGDDMKWRGELPVCKARTWCDFPPIPLRGRVRCEGTFAGAGKAGLAESSRCRVLCYPGYQSRTTPVCRRGSWTHAFACQPVRTRTQQVLRT